jgi:deoxyribodipyrimidine photo-lyase
VDHGALGSSPIDVATTRVRAANDRPIRADRPYVLYWMIAARRTTWNVALDRAIAHAYALRKPLVVFEALEVDYPWASDRLHCFVIEGMHDNARARDGDCSSPRMPRRQAARGSATSR